MSTNPKKNEDSAWNPDTSSFGARLALVRWKMGWNVAEAERECGTTQNLWANWEAGSMPRQLVEVVTKIAWRAKVDRNWLLMGEQSPDGTVTRLYPRKSHNWGRLTPIGGRTVASTTQAGSGGQKVAA